MNPSRTTFVTLIRTHHITSRKKLQRVKQAAAHFNVPFVLVRYGGAPGLMYGESPDGQDLGSWVSAVKDLRYKDFQCVWKPEQKEVAARVGDGSRSASSPFHETRSVAEFGQALEERGLAEWFKLGMLSKRAGQFDSAP